MKMFRAAVACMFFSAFFLASASDASAQSRLTVLHPFGATGDGTFPEAALMRAADGNFYGTTKEGGALDRGTIFRMTRAGVVTVLYSFAGGTDGDSPIAPLIQANDGNFYGTTYFGGGLSLGTVFRMTPAGVVTIIHAFVSASDGEKPRAALLQASDGNLYGTTEQGGTFGRGTLFGMTLAGSTFFRYSFSGGADGAFPYAPVIQARNGVLYGTVYSGTVSQHGRIFRLGGSTVSVVHTFNRSNPADGASPLSALVEGRDGNFYGTTRFGGAADGGTAFRLTPAGAFTVLKSFSAAEGSPDTSLIQARDGNFYGAAKVGAAGYGTLFKMTPAGVVTVLHTFSGGDDGATPSAPLIEVAGGKLLGTTADGGSSSRGVVFRLATGATQGDFDTDGASDLAVFRPSNGRWFTQNLRTGVSTSRAWGASGDVPVPGDYDGDGTIDFAVYRPSSGHWFILKSSTGFAAFDTFLWGDSGDVPAPGDYDGDGKTDVTVFRPSTGVWHIITSSTGTGATLQWGENGDVPVSGNYDGDERTDIAVYRPSTGDWYIVRSSTGTGITYNWGLGADVPVPGDFDSDGKTDVAVYRPSSGTWYVLTSSTNFTAFAGYAWGVTGDVPVPADYDGDGTTDVAIYRPSSGHWFILKSSTGFTTYDARQWGVAGDIPILQR